MCVVCFEQSISNLYVNIFFILTSCALPVRQPNSPCLESGAQSASSARGQFAQSVYARFVKPRLYTTSLSVQVSSANGRKEEVSAVLIISMF